MPCWPAAIRAYRKPSAVGSPTPGCPTRRSQWSPPRSRTCSSKWPARRGDAVRKAFAVGRKEFHQIVRDRRSLAILLFFPAFVLLLFGYALNWDVRHIQLAVDDRDRSVESRALVSAFVNSGYFDLVAIV